LEGFLLLGIAVFCIILYIKTGDGEDAKYDVKRSMEQNMICPHCHTKGSVTTNTVKQKVGIHGGKATAALLTAGISLLGTGLSRKQQMTEAVCSNCGMKWRF
jgi:transcription elongation factor Elf1